MASNRRPTRAKAEVLNQNEKFPQQLGAIRRWRAV